MFNRAHKWCQFSAISYHGCDILPRAKLFQTSKQKDDQKPQMKFAQ